MDFSGLLTVIAAFGFVLFLMLGLAWLARRLGLDKLQPKPRAGSEIACVETLYLDRGRRLVIVKCGSRKHLLLLGQNTEIVVESYDAAPEETS